MAPYGDTSSLCRCIGINTLGCALIVLAASCTVPLGSGGGIAIFGGGPSYTSAPFTVTYTNWLEFNNDLTVSVDSAFARSDAGDPDIAKLLRDFATPASQLLAQKYGVLLPAPAVAADKARRAFTLTSDWSDWTIADLASSSVSERSLAFARGLGLDNDGTYRWRMRIRDAAAEFNAQTPKQVQVSAVIEIDVEAAAINGERYVNARVRESKAQKFADSVKKDIHRRYYRYLKDRFGVKLSPRFRGTSE